MGYSSTLFIGSGAIENAWNPIYRALTNSFGVQATSAEAANLYLARLCLDLRHFNVMLDGDHGDAGRYKPRLKMAKENLSKIRKEISNEIRSSLSKKEICLREQQIEVVRREMFGESVIVTTNWEAQTLETLSIKNRFFLHGSIDNPDFLYLPYESSVDHRRGSEQFKLHRESLASAISCAESSFRIVFWGLGLNPLDAELTVMLSEIVRQKEENNLPYEFVVIDKFPDKVCEKLKMFDVKPCCIKSVPVN